MPEASCPQLLSKLARVAGTEQRSPLVKKALGRGRSMGHQLSLSSQESHGSLSYSNSVRGRTRGHLGRESSCGTGCLKTSSPAGSDGPSAVEVVPGRTLLSMCHIFSLKSCPVQHGGNTGPHSRQPEERVFLQATLHSLNPSLRLFVDTCVASPD